jgi:predicted nucleic acid-binding protein
MIDSEVFIDTNILLYTLSADKEKADQAEAILRAGGLISVQVLNEVLSVARRKLDMSWIEIDEVLTIIRSMCRVDPLTSDTHDRGRWVAERYGLSVYDAMIVAAALNGGCGILYSEDMQDGMVIEDRLRICNPFNSLS